MSEHIDAALRFIPADNRDTWVKVGMAIKSELGDNGYSLWDYWSQTGQSYNEHDARQVWRSIREGAVKIGTLFHIAQENGYRASKAPPPRPIPQKVPPPPTGNTGIYAKEIWLRADFGNVASHPYAIAKGIDWDAGAGRTKVSGRVVGKDSDCLVVPARDGNKVMAVQCISPDGAKQTFGPVSGHFLVLGNTLDTSLPWFVAEGWATAVSIVFHHLNGNGVAAVAFGKSNLESVAHKLAENYQPDVIRILREQDND